MKNIKNVGLLFLTLLTFATGTVNAGVDENVSQLQKSWERIKYQTPSSQHEKGFESLMKEADKFVAESPNRADILIWQGIIESSYAGAKGGLGALGHVKNAKKTFERALEINPNALDGSAYTSLGSLYYQVPSWPIGFGDDKKANEFLKKGLAVNPNGIDPNYFYGDFLFRNSDFLAAEQVLRKALMAPVRAGRTIADEGRRQEINQILGKIAEKRK